VATSRVAGGSEPGSARVVDQDVDLARLLGQSGDLRRVGQVGGEEACLSTGGLDVLDDLPTAFDVAPVHDHRRAECGEGYGGGPPDACRGAGDQSGPAVKLVHDVLRVP